MKTSEITIQQISAILGEPPLTGVPLKHLTSFRVGGPADIVAFPRDPQSLSRLLTFCETERIRHFMLGAGTNVLFHDDGFRGLVVSGLRLKTLSFEEKESGKNKIIAQAGVPLPLVVSKACRLGLTGMESLWGIPGSVGGSVACNAGAGGVSMGDLITELKLVDALGSRTKLQKGSFSYGYRKLNLPSSSIVLEAGFELSPGKFDEIGEKLSEFRAHRKMSQPRGFPNAGCIFKNPSNSMPAGALIEKLGFKGFECGGASVSNVHANFIVNRSKAKASDIIKLINTISEAAQKKAGIDLELELRIVHSDEINV